MHRKIKETLKFSLKLNYCVYSNINNLIILIKLIVNKKIDFETIR